MNQEEFDPDEHDPHDTHEIEIKLTFEEYRFEGENGVLESRPFVVESNLNDWVATGVDEQMVVDEISWMLKPDLKRWLEGEARE